METSKELDELRRNTGDEPEASPCITSRESNLVGISVVPQGTRALRTSKQQKITFDKFKAFEIAHAALGIKANARANWQVVI